MGLIAGIRDWTRIIAALPDHAEEALASGLEKLGVSDEESLAYLRRHLGQLPGWAGYIRWRDRNPDYAAQHAHPIDPVDYLAVRLSLEFALADALCRRRGGALARLPELRQRLQSLALADLAHPDEHPETARICADAWRLFHIAQFFCLSREDFEQLSPTEAGRMLAWLDHFPQDVLRPIWQAAYEAEYRNGLLGKLVDARVRAAAAIAAAGRQRPRAHAVFCIDARSEPFRRNLEAQGDYATLGFAGFFATPIYFRGLDSADEKLLCPVLIKPKYGVQEMPRAPDSPELRRHQLGERWRQIARHLFHQVKANPASSFLTFDVLGFLFGIALVGKTVLIKLYEPLRSGLRQWCVPPISTRIPVDRAPHSHAGDPSNGHQPPPQAPPAAQNFSPEEQVAVTENALRVMSLTREFARIVLLCGHASTTENNPYASAYHCGACGGNPGGPNARVLAALANKPAVRAALQARGIEIPADTWFIAGEHNTTTDEVSLFDLEEVPTTHQPDVRQIRRDLAAARLLNARERCQRLPGAPEHLSGSDAARRTWRLSRDWAQIRPEWGLSSNAAFVIGRRRLTRDLDLGGRVFLHNYDQSQDEAGKVLESIMTAPLVVVQMINFQYYFSATDHWVYGSGTKVLHNVVSGVGVMLGRNSDLQTGFPLQALTTGARRYHEPLRLMAVLEADPERISEVISRHTVLQNFFDNEWVTLVSCAPESGALAQYVPGGHWHSLAAASA